MEKVENSLIYMHPCKFASNKLASVLMAMKECRAVLTSLMESLKDHLRLGLGAEKRKHFYFSGRFVDKLTKIETITRLPRDFPLLLLNCF